MKTLLATSLLLVMGYSISQSNVKKERKELKLISGDNTQARMNNFSYYFNKR